MNTYVIINGENQSVVIYAECYIEACVLILKDFGFKNEDIELFKKCSVHLECPMDVLTLLNKFIFVDTQTNDNKIIFFANIDSKFINDPIKLILIEMFRLELLKMLSSHVAYVA